ncbi:hypothetical protein EOD42_08860 [Rhodovarius crocodyli]|uniref:Uncharacterized protein n=1 Tax=Rhodovarius crocodyli TaxID=1979269 RepID=A0A437MJR2_9PROT|nr:hypothetical protein [Rhodovarius crocodyli]RVT97890.1 hypothetical protein EOD42_08860 [Rhodovarius crocodyli]
MLQNAIEQTTTTVGTGTYDLTDPTDPLRISFVTGIGSGGEAWYRCESDAAWEEGWGTVTAGTPDTLTRNVVRSSNANAAVNWVSGAKRIYCTALADAARFGIVGAVPSAGGTANAQAIVHKPPLLVLRPGMTGAHTVTTTNTGAVTLAIDGLGAQPLRRANGSEFGLGELIAGQTIRWLWTGSEFRVLSDVNRRDLGRELLASTSMVGGNGVEVTVPQWVHMLEVAVEGARVGSGAVQQIYLQAKVGGVWLTGPSNQYFDSRLFNTQLSGQVAQPKTDALYGHYLGWIGSGDDPLTSITQILNCAGNGYADYAKAFTRSDSNAGAGGYGWAPLVAEGDIALGANQRIEAVRIINISGSPRNFTAGRLIVMGARA